MILLWPPEDTGHEPFLVEFQEVSAVGGYVPDFRTKDFNSNSIQFAWMGKWAKTR
jgi:hypothetical protein